MSKRNARTIALLAVAVAALAVVPLVVKSNTPINLLISIFIFTMLASSWNILGGYAGQTSLGHAAFFGVGALAARLLWTSGFPLFLSLVASGVVALVLAMVVGIPAFRLRGVYFAIGTLALGQILYVTFRNVFPKHSPWPSRLIGSYNDDLIARYYIIMAMAVFTIVVAYLLVHSRFGLGMMAVRENEDASESLGVNALKHKLLALGVSAFLAGLAGGAFASYHPGYYLWYPFTPPWSLDVMTMAYIGGVGTIIGPVVGAMFYVLLKEWLVLNLGEYHLIVFGVLFILVVLFLPGGLVEGWQRIVRARAAWLKRRGPQVTSLQRREN